MRTFKRVHKLTEDENRTLVQGTKSQSGFTMRWSHILLLSAEGLTPQQIAKRVFHALDAHFVASLSQPVS